MGRITLQFKDVLLLLEFLDFTRIYCTVELEKIIISGELGDADIELAQNGYDASIIEESPILGGSIRPE